MIALQHQAWPDAATHDTAAWHDPSLEPISLLLLDDDGRVRSALDILSKSIVHNSVPYEASGISAMCTDEASRGLGHGRQLAKAAIHTMRSNGADLGMFTCDRHLRRFYESAGWTCMADSVLVGGTAASPYPSDELDKLVMASFFSAKARAGACDFVGARIELMSGEIDRLW